MTDEEKEAAWEDFITRSIHSQNGWGRKQGPNRHLSPVKRNELAQLRANVKLFMLENPAPPPINEEIPF